LTRVAATEPTFSANPAARHARPPVVTLLERYLVREIIPTFLIATLLYVSLFLVQALLARGQYLPAISTGGALKWLAYQVPAFAVQAFPLATVFAVLMGFGRLAREREVLAMQAGGVSLARAVRPIVWAAAGLVAIGLLLAEYVVPRANELTTVTWWDSVDEGGQALNQLTGKSIVVGKYVVTFGAFDRANQSFSDVRLQSWEGDTLTGIQAAGARFEKRDDGRTRLVLTDFRSFSIDPTVFSREDWKPDDLLQFETHGPQNALVLPASQDRLIAQNATASGFDDPRPLSELWEQSREESPSARAAAVEFSRRTAVPFSNLAILLLTVPVAASATRSIGAAFGWTFLITIAYYLALYTGSALGQQGTVPALAGPWLANLVFLVGGFVAMRRSQFR
jgi:lipopolysaccharide export system permease protein